MPAAIEDSDLAPWRFPGEAHRLVLVNGRFSPKLSAIGALPKGVCSPRRRRPSKQRPSFWKPRLRETDTIGGQPFVSLNAALFADGFVLALEAGAALDRPVEIIAFRRRAASAPAICATWFCWDRAAAPLSSRAMPARALIGPTQRGVIGLGQGRVARPMSNCRTRAQAAIHLAQNRIELGRDARYESFVLTLGAKLSRHDSQARLEGEGAACRLNGAFLLRGEQEATNVTFVDHAAPRGTTRELFKGVADGSAHGVFLGTHRGAAATRRRPTRISSTRTCC